MAAKHPINDLLIDWLKGFWCGVLPARWPSSLQPAEIHCASPFLRPLYCLCFGSPLSVPLILTDLMQSKLQWPSNDTEDSFRYTCVTDVKNTNVKCWKKEADQTIQKNRNRKQKNCCIQSDDKNAAKSRNETNSTKQQVRKSSQSTRHTYGKTDGCLFTNGSTMVLNSFSIDLRSCSTASTTPVPFSFVNSSLHQQCHLTWQYLQQRNINNVCRFIGDQLICCIWCHTITFCVAIAWPWALTYGPQNCSIFFTHATHTHRFYGHFSK